MRPRSSTTNRRFAVGTDGQRLMKVLLKGGFDVLEIRRSKGTAAFKFLHDGSSGSDFLCRILVMRRRDLRLYASHLGHLLDQLSARERELIGGLRQGLLL